MKCVHRLPSAGRGLVVAAGLLLVAGCKGREGVPTVPSTPSPPPPASDPADAPRIKQVEEFSKRMAWLLASAQWPQAYRETSSYLRRMTEEEFKAAHPRSFAPPPSPQAAFPGTISTNVQLAKPGGPDLGFPKDIPADIRRAVVDVSLTPEHGHDKGKTTICRYYLVEEDGKLLLAWFEYK